jgi:hypothetical protein
VGICKFTIIAYLNICIHISNIKYEWKNKEANGSMSYDYFGTGLQTCNATITNSHDFLNGKEEGLGHKWINHD